MAEMIEIRWHGRGGQGTVTAAKVLADACLSGGRYVQAFPEYGPERSGAPLRAYNRISTKELRMHCPVRRPHIVSVVDATLLESAKVAEDSVADTSIFSVRADVTSGTPDDAIFIVNTSKSPKEIREIINAKPTQRVFTVDATKIAIDSIGRALPNAPMLGAISKITNIVDLDRLLEDIRKSFGKKFSQKIIDGNLEAARRGYEEVIEG